MNSLPPSSILHTEIMHAMQTNNIEYIDNLLSSGFDINMQYCETHLIHMAAIAGKMNIIDYLIEKGADVHTINNLQNNILHYAVIFKNLDVIEPLISLGVNINLQNSQGHSPLHLSIFNKNLPMAALLIKNGANLELKEVNGYTALHLSVNNGLEDISEELIQNGADVNSQNIHTNSILHTAANQYNDDLIKILLEKNAIIDVLNKTSATPLHFACTKINDKNIRLLIQAGANVNLQDSHKDTPLHLFMKHSDNQHNGYSSFVSETFLTQDINFSLQNKYKDNILHQAALSGYLPIFFKAINHSSFYEELQSLNFENQNVLDVAIQYERTEIIEFIKNYQNYIDLKKIPIVSQNSRLKIKL